MLQLHCSTPKQSNTRNIDEPCLNTANLVRDVAAQPASLRESRTICQCLQFPLLSPVTAANMASDRQSPSPPQDLSSSGLTIPSDSEPYSSISPPSSSPPQSSNNNGEQPVIIYQPPTFWSLVRGAAINLLLPFVNGLMLGFGELLAHEWAFRLGWSQTNVSLDPSTVLRCAH
jgi:hypothetical protein